MGETLAGDVQSGQRPGGRLPRPGRDFELGAQLHATVLVTGAETGGRHDLTLGRQPPGTMTPPHLHTRYEERFWVISGTMTVWVGADTVVLGPGDAVTVPAGTPHVLQAGPDGCEALNLSAPAAFAELVARSGVPAGGESASDPAAFDPERFAMVSAELGDVVLGPPGTLPEAVTEP